MGFIFIFKVDYEATYFMIMELEYTSRYFTEQLSRYLGAQEEIDYKSLKTVAHSVDLNRRIVDKRLTKKYKFEALLPFDVAKTIILSNNRFFAQIRITNISKNKMFIDKAIFHGMNTN